MDDEVSPIVCPICLDPIAERATMFESHCSTKSHCFHVDCIHNYAKFRLAAAVEVTGGVVSINSARLAKCPVCRAEMTWCHRSSDLTCFFLVGGRQNLMELGTVREHAKRPRLRICQQSYAKRAALSR